MKWHFDEILKIIKKTENTECVICGNKSKQISDEYKEIKQKHTKTYIDGKPVKDFSIIYSLQTCPYCGYTNTEINSLLEDYSKTKICQRMGDDYKRIFYSNEPFFIKQRKLFYTIMNTKDPYYIYDAFSCYYEEIGDTEKMYFFLKKQVSLYENEILFHRVLRVFKQNLYTLIIDGYRRLGEFEKALNFVNMYREEKECSKSVIETRIIQRLEIACLHKNRNRMEKIPTGEWF